MTERATSLVIFHPSAYNGHGDDVSISREFFPAHVARVTAGFQRGLAVEGAGMNLCERYFSPLATVLCFGMTAAHLAGDDSHS